MDFCDLDTSLSVNELKVMCYSSWLTVNFDRIIALAPNKRSEFIKSKIGSAESNPGAVISFLKKCGLVDHTLIPAPLSKLLSTCRITYAEFCLIYLSKQSLFINKVPKVSAIALLSKYIIDKQPEVIDLSEFRMLDISLNSLSDHINSNERNDLFLSVLTGTGLFEKDKTDMVRVKKGCFAIFDYLHNCNFKNCDLGNNTNDRFEYLANTIDGIYKYLNVDLPPVWSECFPNLNKNLNNELSTAPNGKQIGVVQKIVYGAPGTGKSHNTDDKIRTIYSKGSWEEKQYVFRTTFHPDSDYSTFVGSYKPKERGGNKKQVVWDFTSSSAKSIDVKDINGNEVVDSTITYHFVEQVFTKAYVAAWNSVFADEYKPVFLVIEEINRGNCAQVFGDLFQLLDRKDDGFSEYPIKSDSDLSDFLRDSFAKHKDVPEKYASIKNGEELVLPSNLYIWATMNTSDQSLFPMDSAFKRRWDWEYVPICDAGKNWKILVNGKEYDWWSFVEQINNRIWDATHSEDKKLGYFFCKADRKTNENDAKNNIISADKFVGKVLFYIYNDVFKDYVFDDAIFKDKEDGNKNLSFQCYFKPNNGKPDEKKIEVFLKNLEVKLASEVEPDSNNGDENVVDVDLETNDEMAVPVSSFKVVLDGETIEEATQFDTYLTVLKRMGMEKVEEIAAEKKYIRFDCPLVSKEQFDVINENENFSYVAADGYYIIKGINKKGMSNFLILCAERLSHNISIE